MPRRPLHQLDPVAIRVGEPRCPRALRAGRLLLRAGLQPPAYAVAVRATTELLTSGTCDSVAGDIAYDTMNDAITAAP
jgi:hypothetical protein